MKANTKRGGRVEFTRTRSQFAHTGVEFALVLPMLVQAIVKNQHTFFQGKQQNALCRRDKGFCGERKSVFAANRYRAENGTADQYSLSLKQIRPSYEQIGSLYG